MLHQIGRATVETCMAFVLKLPQFFFSEIFVPEFYFKIKFWNKDFTEEELRELQDECHARFYRSPTYLMKQITKLRSWADFTAKARMGTRILTNRLGI